MSAISTKDFALSSGLFEKYFDASHMVKSAAFLAVLTLFVAMNAAIAASRASDNPR
jgi:hypothetical protein